MTHVLRTAPARALAVLVALVLASGLLAACSSSSSTAERNPDYTTKPSDSFPVTVEHRFGKVTIPAEPQRIVVVGITEQDILLELGVTPVATTEWYGKQPYAVWPWAKKLLGKAKPTVLSTTDGFEYEKIASLRPDLIVGTNAKLDKETYKKLSAIAPTIANGEKEDRYFSDWKLQTELVSRAVGRSSEGKALVKGVEDMYAKAAAEHPEFAGKTANFSQGGSYEGNLYVYPAGLNTDFLTDLGFVIPKGLEKYAPAADTQALISAENTSLLNSDVIVFATDTDGAIPDLLSFGTLSSLPAVANGRAVYTDPTLAGAVYFLTPLSQKYVIEHLVPLLSDAVQGKSPREQRG